MKTILSILLIISALINLILANIITQPYCGACRQKDIQIEYYYNTLKKFNSDTTHKWCIKLQ